MRVPDDAEGPLPTLPTLPPLLQLANRFEQAWQATSSEASPPNLADFLPPPSDPTRPASLLELIRVDLQMRWQRGITALLESYLRQFPELGEATSLSIELIYHEFRVRRLHGDRPALADYQKRFPTQYPRLLLVAKREASVRPPASKTPKPPRTPDAKVETSSRDIGTHAPPTSGKKTGEIPIPPSAPPPGEEGPLLRMVGGYRLLDLLGGGTFGKVWKAEAPGGVEVAIKRLSRTLEAHEAQCELQSLEHVKRIRHNYLTQIHAFWVHKGRLHVVMELADGSLSDHADRCRAQGLPGIAPEDLLRYMRESAEALDFLHAEGVHHRDIKPANILLLKGHVKVADFGLVRPLQDTQSVVNATFCGTPTYMAPEVWDNKFSVHSDQWSLAVSYVELRLNRRVFKSRTIPSLMTEIRTGHVDLSPLPEAEQRVLRQALHANPRQRYPSCMAFAQALEAVFHPPAPPPRRRWLPTLIALLACLIAGALLVSSFFWNPQPAVPRPPRISSATPTWQEHVDTGRERTFHLPLLRENYEGPIHLVPERKLPNIAIEAEAGEGESNARVTVRADRGAELRTYHIRLLPIREDVEGAIAFDLTVLYLPPDFVPMGAETVEDDHNIRYHKRIRGPSNAKSPVEFVLVPQRGDSWKVDAELRDVLTFYISRFKITREQFQYFAQTHPKVDGRWRDHHDENDRWPVFDVTVTDAHSFAVSLGGRLPSRVQWDKAAGRYHPTRGHDPYWEGPYKGLWGLERKLRIAVGELELPLPIGYRQTEDDESVYGCRDMAGNGSEWTRNTRGGKDVPLGQVVNPFDAEVYLRGWGFDEPEPLTFERLDKDEFLREDRAERYNGTSPSLGFRVVLEPNG